MSKKPVKQPASEPVADDKPKPRGPSVMIRPDPETHAALVAFITAQRVKPDRAAVGLLALREFLAREGFLKSDPK